ncbi:MAG: hydroxymethylbilane synthase [Bdellovibrionales bacterium]|nr:hydroxymethylbilane synthase [Bdellovibrionales bacterium]
MITYKIGTRGSLLAVTQSTLMKNELERISGEKFELVLIQTQGDQITNKPLWQLEGKDFFTKELDEALLKGEVDFVIHSYKDLGSVRPEGIKLAAITERKYAHDILLMPKHHIKDLKNFKGDLVVGTSSPRRIANLTHALRNYLPYVKDQDNIIRCETLRGNVNSRIKKLKDGNYHAITLALAGLERLAHGEKSRIELAGLLEGLNYFILPQSVFPSAASQGALGIEMRADRNDGGKLAAILDQLNHALTVEEVSRERTAFKAFGGGCHLAVGIHVKKVGDTFLHVHAGEVDGKRIDHKWLEGVAQLRVAKEKKIFVGLPSGDREDVIYDQLLAKLPETKEINLSDKHVFVTSRYTLPTLRASMASGPEGIWAAGTKTAQKLCEEGIWINGTSDSLGTKDLNDLKHSEVLKMLHPSINKPWAVLSHHQAVSDLGSVTGCYERKTQDVPASFVDELKNVGACLWTSFQQYEIYLKQFPFLKDAHHCCGLGKTWQEFQKAGVTIHPLASMQEFYELK